MDTAFSETILRLFDQVIGDPDAVPDVPIAAWPESSVERKLLTHLEQMLDRLQQRRQETFKNPELSSSEEQVRGEEKHYRAIFEATGDAILILDPQDLYVVEANPAACRAFGYPYEEFVGLPVAALVHPERLSFFETTVRPLIVSGGQYHARGLGLRKDGTTFHQESHNITFIYKGKPHILGVIRDISEQIRAEEQLREKEAQYHAIFEATTDALFINNLDGFFVEVNPAACKMYGYGYEELLSMHPSTLTHPDSQHLVGEFLQTIKERSQYQAQAVALHKDGTAFYVEAHTIPFIYKSQPHILGVVRDVTEQVQAQRHLEQRVEERTRELSTLLEVSHNVASTLELKSLLGLILDQLKVVADYTGASILTVEGQELVILANRGPNPLEQVRQLRFPLERMGLFWEILCRREPVMIDNVRDATPLAQAYRHFVGKLIETVFSYTRALMGIPLTLKERVIGILVLTSREPGYFTERHGALAMAIANQAAVAIENARLYEQAQEVAVLRERQRLARELHDSVSQALYGISLGAHTARAKLDRNPAQAAKPLDYVLSLVDAALSEMRALIFELRPESLEVEGLVAALMRQGTALQARHGIAVTMEPCNEPALSLRAKLELYRVAQEALHNTVKHAQAHAVELRLSSTSAGILLEIQDDGIGFDTDAPFPGHLGLRSMSERITSLGGTLSIESAPRQGTRISATIPT